MVPAITPAVLAEVAVQPLVELEIGGVATLVVLAPQILGVGREALVEPALAPVATGDQVAEPLVGQLVGDQRVDVVVDRGPGVEQDGVGQGRRAGVLHAAEDEVGGEDLGVARIRIGDAELPREQLEHLRGPAQGALGLGLAAGRDVVGDRQVAPAILDGDQGARDQGDQVAGVGHVEPPMRGAARADHPIADQDAVGQRGPRRRHGGDHLAGRLLVGAVDAREPVARVLVLALGPRHRRLVGIAGIGRGEVQPAARLGRVVDRELGPGAGGQRGLRRDPQPTAVARPPRRGAVDADRGDGQLDGVEGELGDRRGEGADRDRGGPGHRRGRRIEGQRDPVVLDVEGPVGGVARPGAGQRKLAAHAPTVARRRGGRQAGAAPVTAAARRGSAGTAAPSPTPWPRPAPAAAGTGARRAIAGAGRRRRRRRRGPRGTGCWPGSR
jgi:hypothetical protein